MLVDRASFPRDKVCGDFVGPMALAELADLGVAQAEAFAATSRMTRLALHIDADQPAVMEVPKVDGIPGYGRVIPRLQLDAWIMDAARLAGATVLDGRKAEAVEQAPDAGHQSAAAARPARGSCAPGCCWEPTAAIRWWPGRYAEAYRPARTGSWPCGLTSTTSKAPTVRATSGSQ